MTKFWCDRCHDICEEYEIGTDRHGDDVCPHCNHTEVLWEAMQCEECGRWGSENEIFRCSECAVYYCDHPECMVRHNHGDLH